MELRDYQTKAHMDLRDGFAIGHRSMLLQAPTGSGKTVIAAQLIHGAEERGSPCIFFAHRRELIYQCSDKLKEFGVTHGMIMSGEFEDSWPLVQIASIDTFRARAMKRQKLKWPPAKVVIIDEAHRSLAPTYLKMIERYKDMGAVILGLTATPMRADGKGLGHVYDHMVQTPNVQELINRGYLVMPKHFAPTIPDLMGVKTTRGDYNETQLQEVMDRNELVGDTISNWMRLAGDRQTIVFASGVAHSIHLRDEFLKAGVKAAHIDGTTPDYERDKIIKQVRERKIQVICNCMVLTEGFDEPSLSCCVLARPTKNYGLYLQMAGRVLRPADNKEDAYIIDHSGAVYRHGRVNEPFMWSLDTKGVPEKETARQQRLREKTTITCVKCSAIYSGQLNCPMCNHVPERKGRFVMSRTGDLVAVEDAKNPPNVRQWSRYEQVRWFNQFLAYAKAKGYKRNWAHYKFKDKFHVWPANDFPEFEHVELSREFQSYIRYTNIKWAKGKQEQEKRRADING